MQPPVELLAERGDVALQGREADVGVAGLEPGHRGLRRPHAGRHLGLGETERHALVGQRARERAAARGSLLEAREHRVMSSLTGHVGTSRTIEYGISNMR